MTFDIAKKLAIQSGEALKDYCEIMHITGPVRRLTYADVDKIELICIPRYLEINTVDLFGGNAKSRIISDNFIAAIKMIGDPVRARSNDQYLHIKLKRGGQILGIHLPNKIDFFRQWALTTGGINYVNNTIIPAWEKMGWSDTETGLRRIGDPTARPPAWESEEHFFNWLNVPYIAARQRRL